MKRFDIVIGDLLAHESDRVYYIKGEFVEAEVAVELLEALHEGRRAIGEHFAPDDCYATGPMTGDPIRDLVQCPACSFIAMYDEAITKATGSGHE